MKATSNCIIDPARNILRAAKVLSLWAAATCLLALAGAARADYTATVSSNSVIVTNFLGWGTSLCWWANVVGGYSNRADYVNLAFNQLQLNIVRYNIGGGENSTNHFLTYRTAMPGFEPTNGVWNWNADTNQRWVLQAALARGANLVDAFANSPPWWMTVSGSVTGAVGGTNNLQVADETLFADYLATVVSNLTVLDGDHFNYVTPMNEPVGTKWAYGGSQEGCDMSASQQVPVINGLRTALNISLPSAGIDASEDVDPYQTVSSIDAYPSATVNNLALCTTHTYTETGNTSLASEATSIGKPLWVTEYGDSDGTGLTMAQRIHDDITVMGARAWCYWQVVDSATGWGFLYNPLTTNASGTPTSTTYTINEKFYSMGQFSEFIRPGCEIISVNDSYTLAAWTRTNSTLVLVMVNTNTNSVNVTYNLRSFGALPWQVAVMQTDGSEKMSTNAPMYVTNDEFTAPIPASSVTTFVLTTNLVLATVTNQLPVASSQGVTVFTGERPTFSVNATGSLPLSYLWQINSNAVAGATNTSFTPTAAQLSAATNIFCVVSNPAGDVSSTSWAITVVPEPTASYPRALLSLNPIGYWRLNETPDNDGVTCHDYAGGNNGVYSNVLLAQPGYSSLVEPSGTSTEFGSVLSSNSAASQINCPDFALPSGSNAEFSVTVWINGTGLAQNVNAGIATKGYNYGEELDLDEGAPGACLRFEVRSATGTAYNANSTVNACTNGGWHHLVGVCDEANSNVLLYIDGGLAGSASIPAKSGITNSSTVPLSIGARAQNATSGFNQQFFGWIDDVALFNYALNSNQVQTLYQAGATLPPTGLALSNMNGILQCNWNYGVLQCSANVAGPYQDMTNVTQPCTISISNGQQEFYRVREN